MPSRHVAIRMDQDAFDRLEAESRRRREPLSSLAKRLIEEGLRMEKHPGIFFQDGVTGRRAKLVDGEDVWEAISSFPRWNDEWDIRSGEHVASSALTPRQIWTAQKYYAEFSEEIDERIQRNNEEADRAYAEWLELQKHTA